METCFYCICHMRSFVLPYPFINFLIKKNMPVLYLFYKELYFSKCNFMVSANFCANSGSLYALAVLSMRCR
jgi:hypothetical protein